MKVVKLISLILILSIFLFTDGYSKSNKPKIGYKIDKEKVVFNYSYTSSSGNHNPNGPVGIGAFFTVFDFLKSKGGETIYSYTVLEDVDIETFQIIKDYYAKDKNSVYYGGKKLDVDLDSFNVIEKGYAKDKSNVYYGGIKLFYKKNYKSDNEKVFPENFIYLSEAYAKYKSIIFFKGEKIERNWDVGTFRVLDQDCILDKNLVEIKENSFDTYYISYKDVKFDHKTFERITKGQRFKYKTNFSKDKNNVYYKYTVLPNVKPSSFEVMHSRFFKDDSYVYIYRYNGYNEISFDIVSDEPTGFKAYYFKLENSKGRLITSYYRDSKNVYYLYGGSDPTIKKLNTTPEKFELLSHYYAKDDENIFYASKIVKSDYPTFKLRKKTFMNSAEAEDKDFYYENGEVSKNK